MKRRILAVLLVVIFIATGVAASTTKTKVPSIIEGEFVSRKGMRVSLKNYDGKVYSLPTDLETYYYIDRRPAEITNFRKGLEVYAEVVNGKVMVLEGYSSENPGYQKPEVYSRLGVIKSVDRDLIEVYLVDGSERTYTLSEATLIQRNRLKVKPEILYEGDKVKLYFETGDDDTIMRLEVMGESVKIRNLYSGTLSNVDIIENTVTLTNQRFFKNGDWRPLYEENESGRRAPSDPDVWDDSQIGDGKRLELDDDVDVYLAGQKLAKDRLKYYKDKEAYFVVNDEFGTEMIKKIILKSRYETSYIDKIETIDRFNNMMELRNKKNFDLNDSTVYIKHDRLVSLDNIYQGSSGLVVADGRNQEKSATLVFIFDESINNTNLGEYQLYAGRLQKVVPEAVTLRDFFVLTDNKWESFAEEKEFFFDDEIKLLNVDSLYEPNATPKREMVTPKEFSAREFSVDEKGGYEAPAIKDGDKTNEGRHRRDWYGYFFMKGDRITSGVVSKSIDSLLRQKVTIGYLEEDSFDDSLMGWKIILRDAKDYSEFSDRWIEKNENVHFYIGGAMVIKDGEQVSLDALKRGDKLYLVRDNNDVKFIIVK